ncbi:MAG: response regulator [Lachnospiraceae bacterium]|nr:response regulator [Lachnospiraceae bacterium]
MGKQKTKIMKRVQCILGFMMVGAFLFFVFGEICLPPENGWEESTFHVFDVPWEQVLADGSKVAVTVPGECETKQGEWVTIETMLSAQQEETWVCVRSMQQDMKIYVGEELRKEYSTLKTQPFGKTSTMTYVFFPLYEGDGGETLRIEFISDSSYSGYVSEMYAGDMYDISKHFYSLYAPSAIVAALMVLVAVIVILGSMFVQFFYKRDVELLYLGIAILIAATWLLMESKLRQFVLPNSSVAMLMGFLMIAILPYPFMSYINNIQKNRYQGEYLVIGIGSIVNIAVVVSLQVLNIKDFFETMAFSHIMILALIATMAVTIVLDVIKGYVRDYREVAIGFAALMFAGVCEIGLTYIVDAQLNGIALCIGLVILLMAAGLKTIRDMFNIEKEKQIAIAASESKAQFLANMSHEIRTPINTVIGMNEMILRENKDDTIEEYAYNIKSASQMLLSLINDVLDFSKIEAGKLQIVENDYYLASMLNDVILGTQTRAKQKNLEVKLEIDETMPAMLRGDEIRIKQILNNLLSNAVKYTEKGSVSFSAKGLREENSFSLVLSVEDTGMGIKKEDMDNLFASFQRLELAKNRYIEGTGLGLNITKRLVDIMKGSIEVKSEYGSGSCFTVILPQQIVDDSAMGKVGQRRKPKDAVVQEAQKQPLHIPDAKILVVDDTKMNLIVITELLKRTHAQLDSASGGNECLMKTKLKKYDLILMDHMMPQPDGVQTLHMIREDGENINQKTPIVVLTANAIEGMKEQYLREGFADYLSKPVEGNKLEEMLAKFLG